MAYDYDNPADWGPVLPWGSGSVPAEWLENETRLWQRPEFFRTRHGTAELAWSYNRGALRPFAVWGATLKDGRSVHCRCGEDCWRRRSDDGRGWFPGQMRVFPDRVEFIDNDGYLAPVLDADDLPLGAELAASEYFVARLRDDAFGWRFYYMSCWLTWAKVDTGEAQIFPGEDSVGDIVNQLRGCGEGYSFFTRGGMNQTFPLCPEEEVVTAMHDLGWRVATPQEEETGYERQRGGSVIAWGRPTIPAGWSFQDGKAQMHLRAFRTRHGRSEVTWSLLDGAMRPIAVYWATLADGRWAHCRHGETCWRRHSDDGRGWYPGQIRLSDDRAMFIERDGYLEPALNGKHLPLGADLAASGDFVTRLRDDAFAWQFYALTCTTVWAKAATGETQIFTGDESVAELVVDLRGCGEGAGEFTDGRACNLYHGVEPAEPCPEAEIMAALHDLGWRAAREEEIAAAKVRQKDRS